MTQESQPGPTRGQSQSRLPAFSRRRARRGGESGFGHSGDQMGRGGHLGGAGDEPKLLVESVALGAAGIGADGERGGGRSSGVLGFGVTRHGGRGRWALRDAGVTRNTRRQRAQAEKLGSTKLTGHGGRRLRVLVGRRLQGAIEGGKREGRHRSSQRCRRDGWPARGRAGVAESTEMARVPKVEDEGEGGDAGLPAKRGSVGRTRESRRS